MKSVTATTPPPPPPVPTYHKHCLGGRACTTVLRPICFLLVGVKLIGYLESRGGVGGCYSRGVMDREYGEPHQIKEFKNPTVLIHNARNLKSAAGILPFPGWFTDWRVNYNGRRSRPDAHLRHSSPDSQRRFVS